ncbi:unnamed protein product [Trichobilharzia regenti]|nr:unnamed protein product [Trichobilharzia regenti]
MTTSQCSLALPTDSIHPHKMNSPIVINEWSSASSASASPSACRPDDRLGERVSLNEQQLPEKLVHHALTDSIHTTCSLETQLYNEEEKFIAECLALAGGGVGGGGAAGFNHSPILSRGYSRHARKLDSDPTIILTLLKWARVGSSQLHGDDDQIDRINYQFTSVLLLILLTLTGFRQYLCNDII